MHSKNMKKENLSKEVYKENVYIGNIKRCVEYDDSKYKEEVVDGKIISHGYVVIKSEIYCENEILIKIDNNAKKYVTLNVLKQLSNDLKENQNMDSFDLEDIVLSTISNGFGSIWVDSRSLKPF